MSDNADRELHALASTVVSVANALTAIARTHPDSLISMMAAALDTNQTALVRMRSLLLVLDAYELGRADYEASTDGTHQDD
jgi:3-methyladenine DNA glycosylase AlkC